MPPPRVVDSRKRGSGHRRLAFAQRAATQEESTMPSVSRADHRRSPPQIEIPRDYNAAHDLIERNLAAGRAGKTAYIDDKGSYTYGELAERVNRCANTF